MLTRFQRTKVVQLFRLLDLTRDGHIEYADFVVHAENVRQLAGWSEDHGHAHRLLTSRRALWRKMHDAMDTNRDGEISLDEWLAFFSMLNLQAKSGPLPMWMEEMARLFFHTLDLDDDQRISEDEYAFYLKSIGAEAAQDLFRSALRGGRKALTLEDFQRVVASWLLNQDPNAPVNYVLTGRFPFAPSDLVEYPPPSQESQEPAWEEVNRPIAVPNSPTWESVAGTIREAAAEVEAMRSGKRPAVKSAGEEGGAVEASAETAVESPATSAEPEASVETAEKAAETPQPTVEASAEPSASAEKSIETSVEASAEKSVETSPEASAERSIGTSVEASAEKSVETSVEASAEASTESAPKAPRKTATRKSPARKTDSKTSSRKTPPKSSEGPGKKGKGKS
ncbi:hypothetical protein DYH09_10680 [bacterium CPR1]|nr:hypothetical protein [bacterium CPR1]